MAKRIIGHLDMDAFFASLEERSTPEFKGKPIAVGADPKDGQGRGVVSTANYKAREYGIHSALPISIAWRLSEEAKRAGKEGVVFVQPNFSLYERSSQNILEIIKKYSDNVEQGSIDEFYFDLSSAKTYLKAEAICKKIKEEIRKKEKVTCSIGIGPNKLISKIAAGAKKPDGLFVVEPKEVEGFLDPLPIRKIPGIGPKTAEFLHAKNVAIISDLKKFSEEELKEMLGKSGVDIYYKIRGIDDSPIEEFREAKSIGEQVTFERDTLEFLLVWEEFEKIRRSVLEKFKESGFNDFRTITITVRFSGFETKTSSKSFKVGMTAKSDKEFKVETLKLLLPFFDKRANPQGKLIRLIGVRVENFTGK